MRDKVFNHFVMPLPFSIYLHIPFCTTKCTYCAFNTYTNLETLIPKFVDALAQELRIVAHSAHESGDVMMVDDKPLVKTIFFGGGTPTLLTIDQFKTIFSEIFHNFTLMPGAEITTEANPNDLSYEYLASLREVGFNRLSIGMQSANPQELKLFARRHDHEVVKEIVPEIRRAGFESFNIDLIYGTPYQTLDTWRYTLEETIRLEPTHVSLYGLGLEDGTPLKEWVENGRVPEPDDDLAADMYELATEMMGQAGYVQYEISNWAKAGYECEHNLQYWRNLPYVGVGPGAHGYAGGVRYATILAPHRYVNALTEVHTEDSTFPRTPATVDDVIVSRDDEIAETLIMGLRLMNEGIHRETFRQRFNQDLLEIHGEVLSDFEQKGLVRITEERVLLTEKGRLLSNIVFREFV